MFKVLESYEEKGLGLPYSIQLINAAEAILDESGEVAAIHVPDIEGLAEAVALSRITNPIGLSGAEVKFIRNVLNKTINEFAKILEMEPDILQAWEDGKIEGTMGGMDKLVRFIVQSELKNRFPHFSGASLSIPHLHILPPQAGFDPQITMVRLGTPGTESTHLPDDDKEFNPPYDWATAA